MFTLVVTSGKHRGSSWPLDAQGLLIGRDPECRVALDDDVVSRQHCRITLDGDGARFEDLGSVNPALVNGRPLLKTPLVPGDEISLGNNQFILVREISGQLPPEAAHVPVKTVPWNMAKPIHLDLGVAPATHLHQVKTIQDLALLHEVTLELSHAATSADLVSTLESRLRQRFHPLHLAAGTAYGGHEVIPWKLPAAGGASEPVSLFEQMALAMEKREALLIPKMTRENGERQYTFTLASPVSVREMPLGAVAMQTGTPHGVYDESDLLLFALLLQSAGTSLYVLQTLEQLQRDNEQLRSRFGESATLVGKSRVIRHVRGQIARSAPAGLNVLITGETGTGKELIARLIHDSSPRRSAPFVIVNCAAIPKDLFESELFGYEKGAFTGADHASKGLLTEAHGGTLFLDEVGDLSLENQARILRVVEQRTFRRIGAGEESRVSLRIVAASNKDLASSVKAGVFREDLFHRLAGFEIVVPPLRERPSDVPLLVDHFLSLVKDRAKRPITGITEEAIGLLQSRAWSGNVRELRNCILRTVALARGNVIQAPDILNAMGRNGGDALFEPELSLAAAEKKHIEDVLRMCGGSIREAAKHLQIARSTLYAKIAEYNIC